MAKIKHYLRCAYDISVTHSVLVMHICNSELGPHQFKWWPDPSLVLSHQLSQWWPVTNCTPGINVSGIWNKTWQFAFRKLPLKTLAKRFCSCLDLLIFETLKAFLLTSKTKSRMPTAETLTCVTSPWERLPLPIITNNDEKFSPCTQVKSEMISQI